MKYHFIKGIMKMKLINLSSFHESADLISDAILVIWHLGKPWKSLKRWIQLMRVRILTILILIKPINMTFILSVAYVLALRLFHCYIFSLF